MWFTFFSGSFSKELIISLSSSSFDFKSDFVYFFLILAACLTTFYSTKLFYSIINNKQISIGFFYCRRRYRYALNNPWEYAALLKIIKRVLNLDLRPGIIHFYKFTPYFNLYHICKNKGFKWKILYSILKERSFNFKQLTLLWVYFPLMVLLVLSIISGYVFHDMFLGISSDFFYKDVYILPQIKLNFIESNFQFFFFFKKYFPLILSFIFFFFLKLLIFLLKNH